jgi:carbon storage regulator
MLVLSRKPGQALRIGTELRICVVSASKGQVRLAIEAPEHLSVHREEVFARIAAANREAVFADAELDAVVGAAGEEDPCPT